MNANAKPHNLFDPPIVKRALVDAAVKLSPRTQVTNPVMFVVWIGAVLTTLLIFVGERGFWTVFIVAGAGWLWFRFYFAISAEARAEGRGKAQADTLRRARRDTPAKKLHTPVYGATYAVV